METTTEIPIPKKFRYRRVSFYAGPGCGKSTMAYRSMSFLKSKGIECEFVSEHVKDWAYSNQRPGGFDQVFLFGTQLRKEDILLRSGVDVTVTESPPFLAVCYGIVQGLPEITSLIPIAQAFEKQYPSLNFIIRRKGAKYSSLGRYESHKEAKKMDTLISEQLSKWAPSIEVDLGDFEFLEESLNRFFVR